MSKRDAAVYVLAAKLIDSGAKAYCCHALGDDCSEFCAHFGPKIASGWLHHPFWNQLQTHERQQVLVLALLFMAAIAENP